MGEAAETLSALKMPKLNTNTNQNIRAHASFIQTYTTEEQEFLAEMARIKEENEELNAKVES